MKIKAILATELVAIQEFMESAIRNNGFVSVSELYTFCLDYQTDAFVELKKFDDECIWTDLDSILDTHIVKELSSGNYYICLPDPVMNFIVPASKEDELWKSGYNRGYQVGVDAGKTEAKLELARMVKNLSAEDFLDTISEYIDTLECVEEKFGGAV